MPFDFERLEIPDVVLVKPRVFPDDRGFFLEAFKKSAFAENGIDVTFVQDNHSGSTQGVLRGLHYQLPPFAQGKLVRCIRGAIYDVAVDIRRDSPTLGKWVKAVLSAENKHMLYIPPGFAHGFYVTTDVAESVYKVTSEYSPDHERGIIWNDPAIGLEWPPGEKILSEKDQHYPLLRDADLFE